MENESNRQGKKHKISLWNIIFGICLVGFIVCGVVIVRIQLERKTARDAYSDLRQQVQVNAAAGDSVSASAGKTETDSESASPDAAEEERQPTRVHTLDFNELQKISLDIVGWIKAEGTNVDYPVLQGEDNEYYLHHMYNGEYNESGCIFMDYRDTDPAASRNLVIYGHHMADGSMFQGLMLYKDEEFYEEHPTMVYYTPEGDYTVELISGTVESGDDEFVRFDFADDAEVQDYVESFRARSTFQSDVQLQPGDRIISLCTCSYELENARYMVIGRLVPVME